MYVYREILPSSCLKVDGCVIVPSSSLKNLGIHFDSYLNFDKRISKLNRKTFDTLMYINRIKDRLNKNARVTAIQSLVLSIVNYAIKIWGSTNATQLHCIQKLQILLQKLGLEAGGNTTMLHSF